LLAYSDFDDTPNENGYTKTYKEHTKDYEFGQPTWRHGKGKGLIGAINYLASKGVNAISVNLLSDDENVFPFILEQRVDVLDYDISKLAQWEVVFDWAEENGITLNINLEDAEAGLVFGDLPLSEERKLFYREMVARFGHHLGVTWSLGKGCTSVDLLIARNEYMKSIDPYQNTILIYSAQNDQEIIFNQLLGLASIDGVSLQSEASRTFDSTMEWVQKSAAAGYPWIVSCDEQDSVVGVLPDGKGNNNDSIRANVLWGNIFAGGAGVQYVFGTSFVESDLTLQNFRSRANVFTQSKFALDFFVSNKVPFWAMTTHNEWSQGSALCMADESVHTIVMYKKAGSISATLLAPGASNTKYSVQWFDPRAGGALQTGSIGTVNGGTSNLGKPPSSQQADWVILLKCMSCFD
jgi:Putative collagen-binding domain of a collagenase